MSVQDCVRLHVDRSRVGQAESCRDPPAPESPQMTLFGEEVRKVRRIPVRKRKHKKYARGLQYRIKLRLRKTDRKIVFRNRTTDEELGNDLYWDEEVIVRLHTILLDDSLETLRNHCERKSARAAEIIAWVNRDLPDEPFSFATCCQLYRKLNEHSEMVGPLDPETLRPMLQQEIRHTFHAELPHAKVLRKGIEEAEAGNEDAIEWVLSDSTEPLSFASCCDALGFEVEFARQEIVLPNPLEPDDGLDDLVQRAIDSVFGTPPLAHAA